MLQFLERKKAYVLAIIVAWVLFSWFYFNTTGDSGDSIMHFQFSAYAFKHTENFINAWAKPLFVFLTAPFALTGFKGIQLFNIIMAGFSAFIIIRLANKLNSFSGILAVLILVSFPLYYQLLFSGLTEYLFAAILLFSVYLIQEERYSLAALVTSFLPFARQEGWLLLPVIALFMILKKQYKSLLWLLCGHVFFVVIGWVNERTFNWYFSENPYANVNSVYGSGTYLHFFEKMPYIIGIPAILFLLLGYLRIIKNILKSVSSNAILILIAVLTLAFFSAHVIFWANGLFNSAGLSRVMICVLPLMAIIAAYGFSYFEEIQFNKLKFIKYIQLIMLISVIGFPFIKNPSAINFKKDMHLTPDQQLILELKNKLVESKVKYNKVFSAHNYVSVVLGKDPFDNSEYLNLSMMQHIKPLNNDLIVWDDLYTKEFTIDESNFTDTSKFQLVFRNEIKGSVVAGYIKK